MFPSSKTTYKRRKNFNRQRKKENRRKNIEAPSAQLEALDAPEQHKQSVWRMPGG